MVRRSGGARGGMAAAGQAKGLGDGMLPLYLGGGDA